MQIKTYYLSKDSSDEAVAERLSSYKEGLRAKIEKANKDLAELKYTYKV